MLRTKGKRIVGVSEGEVKETIDKGGKGRRGRRQGLAQMREGHLEFVKVYG